MPEEEMSPSADTPETLRELPPETREFLARLRPDDLQTLEDGVRLVNAVRTVGTFFKWLLIGIMGIVVGTVMLWESIVKIVSWIRA